MFRGRYKNVNDFKQLSENFGIPVDWIFSGLIGYSWRRLKNEDRLTENEETLERMPVEQFNQLQIPVLAFQETDVYEIHHAWTTGERLFRNGASRIDWVCVTVGTMNEYGALLEKLPGILGGLFKVGDLVNQGRVHRLAIVQLLQV